MGGRRREEEGLLLSQMHSLGSEILASVSLRCCLKFWHLLGGKGKDLLPLLLGGKGGQRMGVKLHWAPPTAGQTLYLGYLV